MNWFQKLFHIHKWESTGLVNRRHRDELWDTVDETYICHCGATKTEYGFISPKNWNDFINSTGAWKNE